MPDNTPCLDTAVLDVVNDELVADADRKLEELTNALSKLGYAADAAQETYELLLILRQARVRAEAIQQRLGDVWYTMWKWSEYKLDEAQFKKILEQYRSGKKE